MGLFERVLCSLYNNIKPPSWVASGADFHLFKKGIEPKWEDPRCEHGGKWTVLVPKGPSGKQTMDTYWLNAVCCLAGQLSCHAHIAIQGQATYTLQKGQ